jgi:hypothetical protein
VVKIQERAMRTLFETSDLSAVRAYLQRQWTKILAGRVSLQDFVFAKEASGCAPAAAAGAQTFAYEVVYTGAGWQSRQGSELRAIPRQTEEMEVGISVRCCVVEHLGSRRCSAGLRHHNERGIWLKRCGALLTQVRLGTYINAPPAACVAARAAQEDPRAEPAFGERVPYVVVCGAPSEPLDPDPCAF